MPIFMDRHDIPGATAEDVAEAHQKDLAIQRDFNCRALTYWFDDEREMAFCLIEAPDRQSVQDLHDYAHGLIPNQIIEVEPRVVESFLGRIEDPEESKYTDKPVIRDPAFRSILFLSISQENSSGSTIEEQQSIELIKQIFEQNRVRFAGLQVEHSPNSLMASFALVEKAVECAGEIRKAISCRSSSVEVKMGVSAGVPVSGNSEFFEKAVKLAKRLAGIARPGRIVLSSKVAETIKTSSLNEFEFLILNPQEEKLLTRFIDVLEERACDAEFGVEAFSREMGMSKSKLYRNMIGLLKTSPNEAIKEYRLRKAFELIRSKHGSISEIAYGCGFNSLSYFSRCFQERFELLPSEYLQVS